MSTKTVGVLRYLLPVLVAACWAGPVAAQLRVFSCEPEWAELARVIGQEHVEVFSATTAEQDVHFIQARPSLIARLRKADLLICTGAGLEAGWLPVLQRRSNNPAVMAGADGYLDVSRWVTLRDARSVVDRAEGDVHPEGNPHFHLDPRNLVAIAERLAETFSRFDTAHAADYRSAAAAFINAWRQSMDAWQAAGKQLRGKRVIAHHLDWDYLADWLGFEVAAMLEPKPGVSPSTGHLRELLAALQADTVACVIRTDYQDRRPAQWLAGRAGIPAVELPYTVGGSDETATLEGWFGELMQRLLEHCQ